MNVNDISTLSVRTPKLHTRPNRPNNFKKDGVSVNARNKNKLRSGSPDRQGSSSIKRDTLTLNTSIGRKINVTV